MLVTDKEVCLRCGGCVPLCPTDALLLLESGITCDHDICIECGECTLLCPVQALVVKHG